MLIGAIPILGLHSREVLLVTSPQTDATLIRRRASSECHRLIVCQTLCYASVGECVRCLQEVLIMRKRRVQSKRLNKTVAANRRKRKLTSMKKKVSARNRVFVHLVNH